MAISLKALLIMKAIEATAKTVFHTRIDPAAPGAIAVTNIGDGAIELATDRIFSRIFGTGTTMKKRLDHAINAAFEDANADQDFRFSGFQEYFENNNLIFKIMKADDLKEQVMEWTQNSQKESVIRLGYDEISQFVASFYENLNNRITDDDMLHTFLSAKKAEEAVKAFSDAKPELKAMLEERPASQSVPVDILKTTEDYLQKQLEAINTESKNMIITEGSDNFVANNRQTSKNGSNVIRTTGDRNIVTGNIQESL